MNRTQRRAEMRVNKRSRHMLQQENAPLQIQHGHDGERTVMQFSRSTDNLRFSPEQARKLITAIQGTLDMLEAHLATKRQPVEGVATVEPATAPAANE